jgi:HK97 family phage prohead protease
VLKNAKKADKFLDFTVTAVGQKDASGECIVEGYANTSTKDRVGDVVMPKAFASSLPVYLKNPILLENHNWDKVAGRVLSAEITDKGLFIRARISDTRDDLKTMIREGCLSTFSIGYNEIDADYDEATKTKYIKNLELLEISVVSVPANTEASFTVVDTTKTPVAEGEKPAEAAQPEKCEKCGEPMEKCSCGKSAKPENLKSFIEAAQEASGDKLETEAVAALCDYFITEGKDMKLNRKQLIEALKASFKSAQAAAAPAAAATDAGKADAPADQGQPGADGDMMKQLMAKMDAIAQGIAQLLEGSKPEGEEKPEGEKPEGEKPADDGKTAEGKPGDAPAAQPAADGKSGLEGLTDDEVAALEADIDAQLADLEDLES